MQEGYEGSILFHNCKTGISESSPITGARRYNSASFIAAEPTLLDPTLLDWPDWTGRICKQSGPKFWDRTVVQSYGLVQSKL